MKININHVITAAILSLATLLFFAGKIYASDGTFELRSTTSDNYHCYAASLQMQDLKYTIIVSCRNILFPADTNIFSYIMWATPKDGGSPIKLGAIGLGRATFRSNKPFVSLFVSTEANPNTKSPEGTIVMRGALQSVDFLEKKTSPTPTVTGTASQNQTPEQATTPLTLRDKILVGIKRAGLVSLLALVAVIGLVFVITRARG